MVCGMAAWVFSVHQLIQGCSHEVQFRRTQLNVERLESKTLLAADVVLGGSCPAEVAAEVAADAHENADHLITIKGFGGGSGIDNTMFGNASHMGAYTGSYEIGIPVPGTDDDGNPTLTFDQSGELAAANGDSISFDGSCTVFAAGFVGPVECTYDVSGGTGRFEGVSGYLDGSGTLNADGTFTFQWGGELSSVGSLKGKSGRF